ncbi:unnamed protein product, partial [Gadus morhua 'NCC']
MSEYSLSCPLRSTGPHGPVCASEQSSGTGREVRCNYKTSSSAGGASYADRLSLLAKGSWS